MVKIDRDRIDGRVAMSCLRLEVARIHGEQGLIELQLSDNHEIEVYFPAPQGVFEEGWVEQAREVLSQLSDMDNTVQCSCAEECARSGLPSENYESLLACITMINADTVALRYFGAVVNTVWDVRFVRGNGRWIVVNPLEPS